MQAATRNFHGIGRRKSSVARVWMKSGSGKLIINGKDYKKYFDTTNTRLNVEIPLKVTGLAGKYDIEVNLCGGGKNGQSDAVRLAISRALLLIEEKLRKTLRQNGLLTVDSRVKERKKYGQKAARKKFQFVKR
jgi:small subunit ribosomal protein S9